MVLELPFQTELVDNHPVPAIVERFLARDGRGWNLPSVSTVLPAPRNPNPPKPATPKPPAA